LTRASSIPTLAAVAIFQWQFAGQGFDAATGWTGDEDRMSTVDARQFIKQTVSGHQVVLFMKGTSQFPQCGFSGRAIQILKSCGVKNLVTVNVLDDDEVRQGIKDFANWPTIPQLYVNGQFVGGSDIMTEMFENGELQELLKQAQAV
jgi:monothiol glutaredoxin